MLSIKLNYKSVAVKTQWQILYMYARAKYDNFYKYYFGFLFGFYRTVYGDLLPYTKLFKKCMLIER